MVNVVPREVPLFWRYFGSSLALLWQYFDVTLAQFWQYFVTIKPKFGAA